MISWKQKIFLIGGLITVLLVGALILALQVQSCNHRNEMEESNRKLWEQTGTVVEQLTEDIGVAQTLKTEKSISRKELHEELKKQTKGLTIVYDAKFDTLLKMTEKMKGKSKTTEIVTHHKETETIVSDPKIREQCNTCLASVKVKVPFDVVQGPFHIKGHTLSGTALGEPGDYELDLTMAKKLMFEIVLTQNKKGEWSTFVHSEDFEAEAIHSKLSVKAFKQKWYQKFSFPVNILLSKQLHVALNTGIYYKFHKNVSGGINGGILFLNTQESKYDWQLGIGVLIHSG